jgi:hypothetical protein
MDLLVCNGRWMDPQWVNRQIGSTDECRNYAIARSHVLYVVIYLYRYLLDRRRQHECVLKTLDHPARRLLPIGWRVIHWRTRMRIAGNKFLDVNAFAFEKTENQCGCRFLAPKSTGAIE